MIAKTKPLPALVVLALFTLAASFGVTQLKEHADDLQAQQEQLDAQVSRASQETGQWKSLIIEWANNNVAHDDGAKAASEPSKKVLEPLDTALVVALATLQSSATNHLITLSQVNPAQATPGINNPLASTAQPTGVDGIRAITINIKAQYKSADDLGLFFSELIQAGIGIGKLSIAGDHFDAQIDIFGS